MLRLPHNETAKIPFFLNQNSLKVDNIFSPWRPSNRTRVDSAVKIEETLLIAIFS